MLHRSAFLAIVSLDISDMIFENLYYFLFCLEDKQPLPFSKISELTIGYL